jgi:MFS family permease
VGVQDLGRLGPRESEPIMVEWTPLYHFAFVAWCAVPVIALLLRSNRDRRALAIAAPVFGVWILWLFLKQILPASAIRTFFLEDVVTSLAALLAVLWLSLGVLADRNRVLVFVAVLLFSILYAAAGPLSTSCSVEMQETAFAMIVSGVGGGVLVIGGALAAVMCRRRYTDRRYLLWLAVGVSFAAVFAGLPAVWAVMLLRGWGLSFWRGVVEELWLPALIYGGILYGLVVPFMLLAMRNPFYARRLQACLHAARKAGRSSHDG